MVCREWVPVRSIRIKHDMNYRKHDLFASCLLFLIAFSLFIKTACPVVYVGDSGELTAASFCLGIAHPSGYPLFVILCKAAQFLPLDSIASRANLFSALATAICASVFYFILRTLSVQRCFACFLSMFLVLSSTIWSEATVARVYGLNLLFMLILIHLALLRGNKVRRMFLFCFFSGLALSNHIQSLFTVIPAFIIITSKETTKFRLRYLGIACMFVILGLLCYAEMPVRSVSNPPMDWRDTETFESFWGSVSRRDYWSKSSGFSLGLLEDEVFNLISILERQYSVFFLVLSGIGWLILLYFSPSLAFIAAITGAGNVLMLTQHGSEYDLFETDRYHIPFIACYLAGLSGIARLLSLRIMLKFRYAFACTACLLALILPIRNYYSSDKSQVFIAHDLVFNIQTLLPPASTIFLYADGELFSTVCRQISERFRDDITIIDRTGNMFTISNALAGLKLNNSPERANIEESIIAKNPHQSYCSYVLNASEHKNYTAIPHGFIYKFVPMRWRIQPVQAPPEYVRNRPLSESAKSDFMIQLIINEMYIAGARGFFEFEKLEKTVRYFSSKIETGNASRSDVAALIEFYSRANLDGGEAYYSDLLREMRE